jgi:hypothetical protein
MVNREERYNNFPPRGQVPPGNNQPTFQPPPRTASTVDGPPCNANFQNRGHHNLPSPQYQNNNSRFDFGSSSNQQARGKNQSWYDDQENYDNQGFRREFGAFDEGYFDGGRILIKVIVGIIDSTSHTTIVTQVQELGHRGGGRNTRFAGSRQPRDVEDPAAIASADTPQVTLATMGRAPMFRPVVQQSQVVADQSLVIAAADVTTKVTKKKEILCFRCELTGHFAEYCKAVLCVYCEKATQKAVDCPLLALPKPVAITYGLCCNELLFYEIPTSDELKFKHNSGKVGRITVDGGNMTEQEIITELGWIVLGENCSGIF